MDRLRRLVEYPKVIIEYVVRVCVFDFVFSNQSDVIVGLFTT